MTGNLEGKLKTAVVEQREGIKTVQDKEHVLLIHLERIKAAVEVVKSYASNCTEADALDKAAFNFLIKELKGE